MIDVLQYINNIDDIIHHRSKYETITDDINLNEIFRYYITKYLKINVKFCNFNPGLFRGDNIITKIK